MQKLFTCLYGSKLYGTSTPTSDRDIKHIVLPDLGQLLLGRNIKAKVKKTNTLANTRNTEDDVDEEFIPLQIFARHFVEGQTYAIELAFAIDGFHAEQAIFDPRGCTFLNENEDWKTFFQDDIDEFYNTLTSEPTLIVEFVHELRSKFLTSNIKAMMGYVVNQASIYSFKGERLNATRDLKSIMEDVDVYYNNVYGANNIDDTVKLENIYDIPRYRDLFMQLNQKYPKYFRKELYDIGGGVMRDCFVILEKTLPFTNSLRQTLNVINALQNKYGSRSDSASQANVDWKATMHALRIVDEGIELLENHKLSFPFSQVYVDRLLSIKRGEESIELIKEELAAKLDYLKDLEKTTNLPSCDQNFIIEFEVWMMNWLKKFYNL